MRLACKLAYEGTGYAGWQFQTDKPTIQNTVEQAIQKIAMHPVRIMASGRTDAGVHAKGQVMHFNTVCERTSDTWQKAINYYLPSDIRILWVKPVNEDFHARFSAQKRTYCYIIYQGSLPWFQKYTWRIIEPLAIQAMQDAACILIGEHDFSAFRAARCQASSPIRHISQLTLIQKGPFIQLTITANAFLHHMVRNIVSVLVEVGQNKRTPSAIADLLASCDRRKGSITAPPQGLYLESIEYPQQFSLPISQDNFTRLDAFSILE